MKILVGIKLVFFIFLGFLIAIVFSYLLLKIIFYFLKKSILEKKAE